MRKLLSSVVAVLTAMVLNSVAVTMVAATDETNLRAEIELLRSFYGTEKKIGTAEGIIFTIRDLNFCEKAPAYSIPEDQYHLVSGAPYFDASGGWRNTESEPLTITPQLKAGAVYEKGKKTIVGRFPSQLLMEIVGERAVVPTPFTLQPGETLAKRYMVALGESFRINIGSFETSLTKDFTFFGNLFFKIGNQFARLVLKTVR